MGSWFSREAPPPILPTTTSPSPPCIYLDAEENSFPLSLDSPEVWFDSISDPHVPARLVMMSTAERGYWGGFAVLMWFLASVVLVSANAKHCRVCRIIRNVRFFDNTLHLIVLLAVCFVIYVCLMALIVFRFKGYGFRVTSVGKLFLQILFAVLSCYTSTLFTDKLSAIVACFACLWIVPMCNLFLFVDDFGILEGGLSIVNYAIIGGFGHTIAGWSLVVLAVTIVLYIKYHLQTWLEGGRHLFDRIAHRLTHILHLIPALPFC